MTNSDNHKKLSQEQIDYVVKLYTNGQFKEAITQIKELNKAYPNIPFLFNLIGACYRALGQLEGAFKMFETAINLKSDYTEAITNLGLTLSDMGHIDEALNSLNHAILVDSNYADAYFKRANLLKASGRYEEALESYEKVVFIKPDFEQAFNNLGNLYKDLGRLEKAIHNYKKAIKLNPMYFQAFNNLGVAFIKSGELEYAVDSYRKSIEINPDFPEAYNNLGEALIALEQFSEGVSCFEKAIKIKPRFAEAYYNWGLALKKLNKFDESINKFNNAISIKPDFFAAFNNIASCLIPLGRVEEAIKSNIKALEINPNYALAHKDLGNAFLENNQSKAAINSLNNAIKINPDYAEAYNSLGDVYKKLKKRERAKFFYEKAFALNSNLDFILGNLLNNKMHQCDWNNLPSELENLKQKIFASEKVIGPFSLLSLVDNPAIQRKAAEIYTSHYHPHKFLFQEPTNSPAHKKIRIGYFSGDFRQHPVSYLTAELYEVHNRQSFEIHAFSLGPDTNDELNLRIKAGVDHFHDVQKMSHKDIVLLARSLELDIAVDLAGLTAKSRTDIFAMSVAPIQLSYIGWLGTMGADYYDYLIADKVMIPNESQKYYVEKIVYLPSFQVNDSKDLPPNLELTREEIGVPEAGFVFCCFNNTYKFTPNTFDSWCRILSKVDNSVLLVYANNNLAKTNLTKEIVKRGIDAERLIFGESLDRPRYLARYRVADLFLDTQPYNAGTTASDALKMGLPIVTLKGKSYQARMGASILNAVNLPELITNSSVEYEALAIELAKNPKKLKTIKEKLLKNLSTAPLYNTELFAKNLELAYTKMYERHLKGLEPDHIYI